MYNSFYVKVPVTAVIFYHQLYLLGILISVRFLTNPEKDSEFLAGNLPVCMFIYPFAKLIHHL